MLLLNAEKSNRALRVATAKERKLALMSTATICLGTVEVLGLIADKIDSNNFIWTFIKAMNNHFDILGYLIIGIFMASWLISVLTYKFMQLDKLENRVKEE